MAQGATADLVTRQEQVFLARLLERFPLKNIPKEVMQVFIDDPAAVPWLAEQMGLYANHASFSRYFRRVYPHVHLSLDPTDGMATIARAKGVFLYDIDADFGNWGLDAPARPTERTEVVVHELVADGTFADTYGSLNRPLAELCLAQAQIIGFCVKHRDKLRKDGYGTFFLFECGDELFVAGVAVRSDGRLSVRVNRFSCDGVWAAGYRLRFVFPQLKPLVASAS